MSKEDKLFECLQDPFWSAKTKGVFAGLHNGPGICWDDLTILAGTFTGTFMDELLIDLGQYIEYEGFVFSDATSSQIAIPGISTRALSFQVGDQILCCGRLHQVTTSRWKGDTHVTLTKRPVFDCQAEWDFVHLFAGAFHGWSQAVNMLPKFVDSFRIGAQLSIDSDSEVAQVWMERHKQPCHVGPLRPRTAFEAHYKAFAQTHVFDHTMFNLVAPHANMCYTASPPCQPWSKGGRAAGLASLNGWAFVDTIRITIAGQPHMLALECVDDVAVRPHFTLLCALLAKGGYQCTWQQVVPYHQLSHVNRTRWLSVWLRSDIFQECDEISLPVRAERVMPWSSQHYRYVIPRALREQLTLTQSELKAYGNYRFLPQAKQRSVPADASVQRVLKERVQDPFETLPTLCASYGNQHNLLADRGIFAVLDHDGKDFFFIDPFAHCALLGATESIVVSFKMVLAFRQIGNAVSVPQAILTLGVGFRALLKWDLDVITLVLRCWAARLTSFSSFVVHGSRFATLCSIEAFVQEFSVDAPAEPFGTDCVEWRLTHCYTEASKTIFLPGDRSPRSSLGSLMCIATCSAEVRTTRISRPSCSGILLSLSSNVRFALMASLSSMSI